MSVRQYIGARYVPIVMGEWDSSNEYEPLSIVLHQGNSFTSRQHVPAGIDIDDATYWAPTGNYNAQVEAYRQEVQTFDGRITDNADAIVLLDTGLETANDNIESISKARIQTENLEAYIRFNGGNDTTAILGDPSHPFKNLQAAIDRIGMQSANYHFRFLDSGTHYVNLYNVIGGVWHFMTEVNAEDIDVHIIVRNDETAGQPESYEFAHSVTFYDAHVNFYARGTNCHFYVDCWDDGTFELEGSTLYATNTFFHCNRLFLIQGSHNFVNCGIHGRVEARFADCYYDRTFIRNNSQAGTIVHTAAPALSFVCCNVRLYREIEIGQNILTVEDLANTSAIVAYSSFITISTEIVTTNNVQLNYHALIDLRSCLVFCSDAVIATMEEKAQNAPILASLTLRSYAAGVVQVS